MKKISSQIESPKREGNREKYNFMHVLMNKAGHDKEERKRTVQEPLPPNESSFVYFKRYQDGFS